MDPKELRGLMEAYSEVYAPQEEIEEGLRSAVRNLLGGGKKEETSKPESRGTQLRKKYNVGPEKSDTSAKRQILDRSRARAERDEKEFGGSKYSKSVAQKSKDAHNRYLKAGYSKYGADDARGSGNKARKRAAALSQEDFDWIVDTLLDEGYDLSPYTYDEFYGMCINEISTKLAGRVVNARIAKTGAAFDREMKDRTPENMRDTMDAAGKEGRAKRLAAGVRTRRAANEEVEIFDTVLEFLQVEGYAETLEEAEWLMANMIDEEAIGIILGEGVPLRGTTPDGKPWRVDPSPVGPRPPRKMERDPKARVSPKGGSKDYKQQSSMKKDSRYEEVEYVDEAQDTTPPRGQSKYGRKAPTGYMQTRKPTLQQMSSREKQAFRDRGIGEEYVDEAQEARNNPEKYEREQSKKYAPVRGEKTPMPPRGDKRREDFEKWYAANVR
jgi:hypothetical protein